MNWRPIKTAPKEEMILLSYLGGNDRPYVSMGRWVEVPHTNHMLQLREKGEEVPQAPYEGHFEIAYVAIMQTGGAWNGYTWQERTYRVDATHWMPLPKPCSKTK